MRSNRFLLATLLLVSCTPRMPDQAASATPTAAARPTASRTRTLAPPPTPAPSRTPFADRLTSGTTVDAETLARHQRIFEQLWNTLDAQYVYPDFNGVDWDATYEEIKASVDAGMSDEDFWRIMSEMIGRLDDGHSRFLTPTEAREQDSQMEGSLAYGGIGIEAGEQIEKRQAVIYDVFRGGPAEESGLRPHDVILSIDGLPAVGPGGASNMDRIRGAPGTPVTLVVKSPGEAPREVTLIRRRVSGAQMVTGRLLSEAPGDRFGYMFVPNLWEQSIAPSARQTLIGLMTGGPLDGLIIDMRTNGGGLSTNLLALLGFFTEGNQGEFVSRDGARRLVVSADPIGNSQEVPIVVLTGEASHSYAEVFSGVLREAGRARLVGQTTQGNIETIYGYNFEDGSRAWIARETFVPPSGDDWERTGLIPNVIVDVDWDEFTAEKDPAIAAALELLAPSAGVVSPAD